MPTATSRDGTEIAFDLVGEGPPVVLVGGAFSYRAFPQLAQLAELLAEDFTVVNYDRRGRGESGDTPPYAVEREIEDLEALTEITPISGRLMLWITAPAALRERLARSGSSG